MVVEENFDIGEKLNKACERLIMDGKLPFVVMSESTYRLLRCNPSIHFPYNNSKAIQIKGEIIRNDNEITYSYYPNSSTVVSCYLDDDVPFMKFIILAEA